MDVRRFKGVGTAGATGEAVARQLGRSPPLCRNRGCGSCVYRPI